MRPEARACVPKLSSKGRTVTVVSCRSDRKARDQATPLGDAFAERLKECLATRTFGSRQCAADGPGDAAQTHRVSPRQSRPASSLVGRFGKGRCMPWCLSAACSAWRSQDAGGLPGSVAGMPASPGDRWPFRHDVRHSPFRQSRIGDVLLQAVASSIPHQFGAARDRAAAQLQGTRRILRAREMEQASCYPCHRYLEGPIHQESQRN